MTQLRWDGNTGRSASTPDPDAVRQRFEEIGSLYERMVVSDNYATADGDGNIGVQALAGFLAEVKRALTSPQAGREMLAAINRYEGVREPE